MPRKKESQLPNLQGMKTSTNAINNKMKHLLNSPHIHGEGKEAFIDSLACSIESARDSDLKWQLDGDDLVKTLQSVKTKESSLWDRYIEEAVKAKVHLSAATILDLTNNYIGRELFTALRKELGRGVLQTSERKVQQHKHILQEEFTAVMQPSDTATGYKINPARLVQVLHFLYFFLPNGEWWRLWGDGRKVHKTKQCSIQLSCINNEMVMNGYQFHSAENIHPITIFYGPDSRYSLRGEYRKPRWKARLVSLRNLCSGCSLKISASPTHAWTMKTHPCHPPSQQ